MGKISIISFIVTMAVYQNIETMFSARELVQQSDGGNGRFAALTHLLTVVGSSSCSVPLLVELVFGGRWPPSCVAHTITTQI